MKRTAENDKSFAHISYWRLLKYAFPYWRRMAIGIFFGLIVGGSLFSTFLLLPKMLMIVEQKPQQSAETMKKAEKIVDELNKPDSAGRSIQDKREAVAEILSPKNDDDPKLTEALDSLAKTSEKWDLPVKVDTAKRHVGITWPIKYSFFVKDQETGRIAWQLFTLYVLGFVLLWSVKNAATYINHYCLRWVGARVVYDMRKNVYNSLIYQSMSFYGHQDVGHLISRCTQDTQSVENSISEAIADLTRCPIEILACVAALIYAASSLSNLPMMLLLLAVCGACIFPVMLLSRLVRNIYHKTFRDIAEVNSRLHETFTGISVIKANNTEKLEMGRFDKTCGHYFKNQIRALRWQLLMSPLMELVAVIATLIFLVFAYRDGITITQMATILAPAILAYRPIKELAKCITHIQKSMAAADRYFDLVDRQPDLRESENPVEFKSFEKDITFEKVDFCYEPEKKILDGLDLTISKGQMVAVVGETGSGKTTIASLIARFYDPTAGSVKIDGVPVKDYSMKSLHSQIGIVTQDPILFNDTIANNIAYGTASATREQIVEAAKQANAHDFIVSGSHPMGYDEEVGEKGCVLSGGEKQRVAIARAILKNPPILILDEATSALDTVTEKLVQDALNRVMTNRTVFAIAHRLSTIRNADKIIVLAKGKIVEAGTHDELMALNGRYRKLHDTQFAQD